MAFRTNNFLLSSVVVLIISYPIGTFWASVLPKKKFKIFGTLYELNPGPFAINEHFLVYMIAGAGGKLAFCIDNLVVQKSDLFIGNNNLSFSTSLFWVLTIQYLGFCLSGLFQRFLVTPDQMIWPRSLPVVALFRGFHQSNTLCEFKISKSRLFFIFLTVSFLFGWIPQYFFVGLQSFAPLCFLGLGRRWNLLFSAESGIGLGAISFNLNYISNSLTSPWWSMINKTLNVAFLWTLIPLIFRNIFLIRIELVW